MKNRVYKGNYYGGHFVKVTDPNGAVYSKNPGDLEQPIVEFPFSYEHVHEAVLSARRGYAVWRRLTAAERYTALQRYRNLIAQHQEDIAYADSFEIGKPLWEARREVQDCLSLMDDFLSQGSQTTVEVTVPGASGETEGKVRYVSRGVLVVVSQSILPLISSHHHLIPALLNGNTVVLKTTKHAPYLGQVLAECAHEAGLPAGALNFIQGDGEVARRLTAHTGIDGVLFTGTPESAVSINKQLLSEYWKTTVIQSGGKNTAILWEDCNYQKALNDTLYAAYITAGQRYTTTNRIVVHEKIYDKFVKDFHTLAKKCSIGYGLTEGPEAPFMGPLVSENAVEDYVRYQGIAVREGCEELMRGKTLERTHKGFYVSPSIHLVEGPDSKSVYQTSEFFGPNVGIYRTSDLDEAAQILNITQYGLVASVYTAARETFRRIVEDAEIGAIHWNLPTTHISFRLPVAGMKKSGNGRPMGSVSGYQCTKPIATLEAKLDAPASYLPDTMPKL